MSSSDPSLTCILPLSLHSFQMQKYIGALETIICTVAPHEEGGVCHMRFSAGSLEAGVHTSQAHKIACLY